MKEGFILPAVPARGQGTKAVFCRHDVYGISLFDDLLRAGFRREIAASHMREFAKVFHKSYEFVVNIGKLKSRVDTKLSQLDK